MQRNRGRVTVVALDTRPNRYEALQALLVTLLFFVHFVLFGVILIGGVHIGVGIGVVELVASRKMTGRLTLRAPDIEAPTSVGSVLNGLRPWLLGFGLWAVIFSIGYLIFANIVNHYD